MAEIKDNPARALYQSLEAIQSIIQRERKDLLLKEVWANAFNVAPDTTEMGASVHALTSLAIEARIRADAIDSATGETVRHIENAITRGTMAGTSIQSKQYWRKIDGEASLRALKPVIALLDRFDSAGIEITDSDALVAHLLELVDEVRAATDLDPAIQTRALGVLESLIEECRRAPITSAGRLQAIAYSFAGKIIGDDAVEGLKNSATGKTILAFLAAWHVVAPMAGLPPPDPTMSALIVSTTVNVVSRPALTPAPKAIGPGSAAANAEA